MHLSWCCCELLLGLLRRKKASTVSISRKRLTAPDTPSWQLRNKANCMLVPALHNRQVFDHWLWVKSPLPRPQSTTSSKLINAQLMRRTSSNCASWASKSNGEAIQMSFQKDLLTISRNGRWFRPFMVAIRLTQTCFATFEPPEWNHTHQTSNKQKQWMFRSARAALKPGLGPGSSPLAHPSPRRNYYYYVVKLPPSQNSFAFVNPAWFFDVFQSCK